MADKKSAQDLIKLYKNLDDLIEKDLNKTNNIFNSTKQRALELEKIQNNQRLINDLKSKDITLTTEQEKKLREVEEDTRKLIESSRKYNKSLETRKTIQNELNRQLKIGLRYLMDSDKTIKSTILSLGLSGSKADAMRASFEGSAGYVARLGGNLSDVGTIMEGYADETGRARAMSEEMVKDITAIGYGTGLGVEQATKLGAQFEYMGFNAKGTMEYVQGVVDTSERMGVNTTKVLKNVNDNFKRLNKYTFQQGVKGFAQMAMYAEKFKVDIGDALNAADVAKSLEGAIDLSAQLQVMGGEFAKTDPFELLYLARNDPAKMQERLGEMTKGLVSFRKIITADGKTVFEKFISPADRDRIAAVEKSMGMEAGSMVIIAQRQAEVQRMRQQMSGMGLSAEQKKLIEGAAQWDQKTGKFQVELGGTMRDIRDLTSEQADTFKIEQVTLEKRAEEAMTFEKVFQATIEELKSALLPILKSINTVLSATREFLRPAIDWLQKGDVAWLKVAGMFISAGLIWKGLLQPLAGRISAHTVGRLGAGIRGTRGLPTAIPATGAGSSGLALQRQGIGAGAAAKGTGAARAGTGVAAAGIGVGIMLAAKGIGEMAEKMALLDKTQIWALPATVLALSLGFWALSPAIVAVGTAGSAGALGLLALGAAVVGIGFGINLATKGIGEMALGLGSMMESSKGAGKDMMEVGVGIAGMAAGMALFTVGALGIIPFSLTMKTLAKHAPAMAVVGDAFKNIQTVLSGSRDDFIAVENAVKSISGANVRSGGVFADLSNLLKKPLKVEFADNGTVSMTNDITLNLDGQRFMNKAYDVNIAVQKHESLKHGKGS